MGWLIALGCLVAWLAMGYVGGRMAARRIYHNSPWLSEECEEYKRQDAAFAYGLALALGPLGIAWLVLTHIVKRAVASAVPEIAEQDAAERAREKRRELAELQRQIDDAHRALGIAPLRRDESA